MRIAFFGTPDPAVPALEAFIVAEDVEVAAVVTNPDRPSGRGHKLHPPPVKVAAAAAGVPVWQPQRPREILDDLRSLQVDACAVRHDGALLPQDVLDAGGKGFVNLHFSLLPAWRGAAPVQHALLAGDSRTGVTCFVLEAGMDTGPVLLTAETGVTADETAGQLIARLAVLGAPVLVDAVRGLVDGSIEPVPQDHAAATYAPKISPDDARLDWSQPAAAIANAVRAFNPVPGAWTTLRGDRLKVHAVAPAEPAGPADGGAGSGRAAPGSVVAATNDGPVVATGEGALALMQVQPAGKPRMTGADFLNGYRPVGERLG
ncbi:MAG TPA: methionyl-tRNA formyltransferase [Egibacteraceae bacterium]|nr:methionyl-tRNA formyltransferase [Egibacteraceae bacterium]